MVTVPATASVQEAARLMHQRGVRRLCVTDDTGHLTGIVTRGDLLRGFVRTDDEIAAEIRDGVMVRAMWMDPTGVEVAVHDGLVRLVGEVERRSEAEILASMTSGLDGVVGVDSRLTWRLDDRVLSVATNARF